MSRLWPERLHASLAPGSAALLTISSAWRRTVKARQVVQCAPLPDQPWQRELQALASLLAEYGRGKTCSIVLSNHYVRYQLLPSADTSMSEAELKSLAKHFFMETYGEVSREWIIRISGWNRIPSSPMACAIDELLLSGLHEVCDKAGIRLVSVQPYLATGFYLADKRIRRQRACFAQVEAGRLVLATLEAGIWQGLRNIATGNQWIQDLEACMKRETLVAGWSDEPVAGYLHVPDLAGTHLPPEIGGHRWQRLTGPLISGYSPQNDKPFVLAASSI